MRSMPSSVETSNPSRHKKSPVLSGGERTGLISTTQLGETKWVNSRREVGAGGAISTKIETPRVCKSSARFKNFAHHYYLPAWPQLMYAAILKAHNTHRLDATYTATVV